MGALQFEIGGMRGGSERKVDASIGESREECGDARKGLCGGKMHALKCRLLDGKFRTCYGKLSPGMEYFAGLDQRLAFGVIKGQAQAREM